MTRTAEWGLSVLAAAAFGTLWLAAVVTSEVSTFATAGGLLSWWAVTIVPAVFAARFLIRHRPAGDGPDRLFATAAALMPAHREDWVAAMRAELAHVPGTAARWSFAGGCVRAALMPRAGLAPVAVAMVAGVGASYALPDMTLFAMTFAGLLVLLLPVRLPGLPPLAGLLGLAGVASCVAVVTYLVVVHPSMGAALLPGPAVILATVLAGCARLALAPPRVLMGDRTARAVGVVVSVGFAVGFVLASRLPGQENGGVGPYLLFPPIGLFFVCAAVAATRRSFRTGVLTAIWTILLGTTWVFVLWLMESEHWDRNGMGLLFDADGPRAIGVNLGDGIKWVATWLPVWGLPIGVLGAAAGARRRA
jgi:hypothetical protein